MPNKRLFCKYGLIGENLNLKKDIGLEIDNNGKIIKLEYDNPGKFIDLSVDDQNFLLIPGFINSHVHIGDSFAKEKGFNRDLIEIVAPPNGLKHKLLKNISDEVKIEGIKKTTLEMLSNGITYFVDFRERSIEGINLLKIALKESPMKFLTLGRFLSANEIESVFKEADGLGLSSYKKTSTNIKKLLKEFKFKFKKPIACHCAEYRRDKNLIDEIINDRLVDIVVHGTKFLKEDLERLKKRNISLILCPRCNGYFGVGFPPINEVLKLKMPIALGTDNLMANNADLFEEMRYLYRISRVLGRKNDDIKLTAKGLLKMVTINAARLFELDNQIGSISEGKFADFFLIDLNDPNFYCYELDYDMFYPLIVQRTRSENIKQTYINGKLVFERKK